MCSFVDDRGDAGESDEDDSADDEGGDAAYSGGESG